jgi:hypothetical protein
MTSRDREYFMLRAEQESVAAANSYGQARGRHEELASIYRMRVMYIDRGLVDDAAKEEPVAEPVHHIIVPA